MRGAIVTAIVAAALMLGASPASAAIETYTNPAPIAIPGSGTLGPASPYPSSVAVAGRIGPITNVNVTLHGLDHTRPQDLRVVLRSPSGWKVALMDGNCGFADMVNVQLVFSQQAASLMPRGNVECPQVAYRPNATTSYDPMPAPGPAGPFAASLDVLQGDNPNGTWQLWIQDRYTGEVGQIRRGWTLTLSTDDNVDMKVPGVGTQGVAAPYPAVVDVAGKPGVITDVDVTLGHVWHQNPGDLELLLVGPGGQEVLLMDDACGDTDSEGAVWTWDDEALFGPMPVELGCPTGSYQPAVFGPEHDLPAPAPAGPYARTLSAFDLTDPNGQWRMYAVDDQLEATGFIGGRFQLVMKTRERAAVTFAEPDVRLAEDESRELTLRRSADDLKAGAVTVTTAPATAGADDFTPVSTTVEFAAGQTERTVRLDARADAARETDESYTVAIASATGDARVGDAARAAVTIADVPPVVVAAAAPRCAGRPATLVGTAEADRLRGTRQADVIVALGGNDVVEAGRGNDLVCAGSGHDRVSGGSGRDRLLGGAGRDRLLGGTGRDRLLGGAGRDSCGGGPGRDSADCEQRRMIP